MKKEELIEFFIKDPSLIGLEIHAGNLSLKLKKLAICQPPKKVCANWIGWFTPKVEKGEKVNQDQILGEVLTAGVRNEIASPYQGKILEVLALPGEPVEYGQALFKIAPTIT